MKETEYSPRCRNREVVNSNYDNIFACPRCNLDFMTDSLQDFEPDDVLSVQEMTAFFNVIKTSTQNSFSQRRLKRLKVLTREKLGDKKVALSLRLFFYRILKQKLVYLLLITILLVLPIFFFL